MNGRSLTLLKLGGELLEEPERLADLAGVITRLAEDGPLVVVHGGGREIDAALKTAGIAKRQVDGLRITDVPTLDVVVSVLAGALNTRLVAAIVKRGGRAVGLTGADARLAPVERWGPYRAADGSTVDLGLVGDPRGHEAPALLVDLCAAGYVPVVASLGITPQGEVLNVNADTLAGFLAGRLKAARLLIAGATAGVLDADGRTLLSLDSAGIDRMVAGGTASAGMVAKLTACRKASADGVADVRIVDGRVPRRLEDLDAPHGLPLGTRVVGNAR